MTNERHISGKFGEFSLDENKVDDAILALLRLGLHAESRAWKGFDWDSMERLREKGLITDPVENPVLSGSPMKAWKNQNIFCSSCSGNRLIETEVLP